MLILESLIIIICLVVFLLQSKLRNSKTETSKKIVYWTIMFFVSLSFNTILFSSYGYWYDIKTYISINTLLIIVAIAFGYLLIQLLSPFKHIKKFLNIFKRRSEEALAKAKEIELTNEETKYARQMHFEIFLETICWIGFISIFAFEGYINILGDSTINNFIQSNFIVVLCLLVMLSLPITLRQILFYLFNIRAIKENPLSNEELNLQMKLRQNNFKL